MVGSALLILRLSYWQLVLAERLTTQGKQQQTTGSVTGAHRGIIYARDKTPLASVAASWRLFSYLPSFTSDPEEIARKLTPIVEPVAESSPSAKVAEEERLTDLLKSRDTTWVALKQKVDREMKKKIEDLKVEGLGFDELEVRQYPEASMAAHLLGFVGKDDDGYDKGYFGIEGYYDLLLSGKTGYRENETNAIGVPITFGHKRDVAALTGVNLVTTIDKVIQMIVEKKLKEGIEKYEAQSGTIVVMDPKNGELLALASLPTFDPLNYVDGTNDMFRNPAISDSFEPGSIFKPLVMAAAFDKKLITPDTQCDICRGPYKIDKYSIQTWDNKYYPNSTMTDVIKHSDNVGMVFIGNKLGKSALYEYLVGYGFGKPTGVDLQGEIGSQMRELKDWSNVDLATATFGQGIAVTPIQMMKATSALANGGVPVTPHVVKELELNDWNQKRSPSPLPRVISKEAADSITGVMIEAVKKGEAQWAVPKGYEFAGKTGTAQIAVNGQYDEEKTNASFIGFAPARDPKYLMLVIIRQPKSSQWASETAAPLWFDISVEMLNYMGILPNK